QGSDRNGRSLFPVPRHLAWQIKAELCGRGEWRMGKRGIATPCVTQKNVLSSVPPLTKRFNPSPPTTAVVPASFPGSLVQALWCFWQPRSPSATFDRCFEEST